MTDGREARWANRLDAAQAWVRALQLSAQANNDQEGILPRLAADWARDYGNSTALISDAGSVSFRELEQRMNRYSRWALNEGVQPEDVVALVMGNCSEYFLIWLGLIQVGAIVALVSPDLPSPALAQALRVAGVSRLIASATCLEVCRYAVEELDRSVRIWVHESGATTDFPRIDQAIEGLSGARLSWSDLPRVTLDDRALRIFTSGTSGLPKAAEVSHRKLVTWTHWFAELAGLTSSDRLYNCLPMHHSVGGVVAVAAPLVKGGSVAIGKRFSTQSFWSDFARWKCTTFQYIGELCRYLVAAPVDPCDRLRGVRLAIGNGLSTDVWRAFLDRFGPLRILEFYASTEGNVWLYNVEAKIGSIGRVPPFLAMRDPIALARFDYAIQAPARGQSGFCERCADGEVGEALGRIDGSPGARFEGYSESLETERKILRNVFKTGDAWLRTGDLMSRDADGFYAFVDRIGDTFRWKGENVSTRSVEAVLYECPGVQSAVAFGVGVTGADGRAGMALLKVDRDFDLDGLPARVKALPRHARPLFLRFVNDLETTETFKLKRRTLSGAGFRPGTYRRSALCFRRQTGSLHNSGRATLRRNSDARHGFVSVEMEDNFWQNVSCYLGAPSDERTLVKPNLFIIGSMKSGTTLLRNILASHPQIHMSAVEEPCFFADCAQLRELNRRLWNQGYCGNEEAYLRLFSPQKGCVYFGEASAYYTHVPLMRGVADRIRRFNPDARLLYIIRDPVERTISHYWHRVMYDGESRTIEQAIIESSEYRDVSNYIMQLAPFYTRFHRSQIGVYTLEELVNNYEETVASVFQWLEVKPVKVGSKPWANRTPELVKQRLSSWSALIRIVRRNKFNHALMETVPASLRARAHKVFSRDVDRRQVDVEAVGRWLRPLQREQTRELSALLGRDFKEWKTLL